MKTDEIFRDIRLLAAGEAVVSDELSEMLYRHRCFYLLMRMPQDSEWKTHAVQELTFHQVCLRERYKSCQPVWNALAEQGIPYAVVKGAVLSQAAYGNVNRRVSGDVDMLIRREDTDRVKAIFRVHEFTQGRISENDIIPFTRKELLFYATASHQLAPFIYETSNRICSFVNADVNFNVFWGEHRKQTDMAEVLAETEDAVICGAKIRKLKPEMEFIALCLHHYKDMNSLVLLYDGSLRLELFSDLYFYLKNNPLCVETLLQLGQELSTIPYLYYCLYYTDQIFDDVGIKSLLPLLYTEEGAMLLNRYGLSEEECKSWEIGFKERLFTGSLRPYMEARFGDADREKVQENRLHL